MEDIVRDGIDERITELLEHIEGLDKDSEEYAKAIKNLETLYKLRMDEKNWMNDQDTMLEDVNLRVKQQAIDKKRLICDWGKAIIPAACGLVGTCLIVGKEELGAVTSKALSLVTSFFRFKS